MPLQHVNVHAVLLVLYGRPTFEQGLSGHSVQSMQKPLELPRYGHFCAYFLSLLLTFRAGGRQP